MPGSTGSRPRPHSATPSVHTEEMLLLLYPFSLYSKRTKWSIYFLMEDCAHWAYSLTLHKRGPLFVDPVSIAESGDKVTVPKKHKKILRRGRRKGNGFRKRP